MSLNELVHAVLNYDALAARQWVADAQRAGFRWGEISAPTELNQTEMALAAGLVELFAERAGIPAPPWTQTVKAAPQPRWLVRGADTLPRLRIMCEHEGPAPLRRRGLFAPPEFLTVA